MAMIRRFALLLAVLATSLVAEPTAAATEAQLLATCRSYDVAPATAAAACQTLGFATRKGENEPGKVIDWPKALWFHDRACTLGDAGGCMSTGFLYTSGKIGMSGNPPQPALEGAFSYFRRGCELSAAMCFVLATAYERGKGIAKNLATADQLYARACTSLAGMTEKGIGMAANPARAAQLRQTACGLDKAQCAPAVGVAGIKPAPSPAAAPKPVPAPTPAAKPAEKPSALDECYKSADKLAAAQACADLGFVLEMDTGNGSDHEGAGRLFHRACSLGLASGCRNLGTKFLFGEIGATGNPPAPNHKLAVLYFRKACDLDASECTWLGGSYESGEGVGKDLAEALRLHHKSCAAKDGYGCFNAAEAMGKLGKSTPAQILQIYSLGCDYDDVRACAAASRRYEKGLGAKADPAKAEALRQKACQKDFFHSLEEGFCPKVSAPKKSGS